MRTRKITGLAAAVVLLAAMTAAPAAAGGGAQMSTGSFQTLQGGVDLGYDITGVARMMRLPAHAGATFVWIHVAGLDANTMYPAHVHNGPCNASPAGGSHYQHVQGGAVDAVNEIWPAVRTRANGRGTGFASHDHWARPEARSIVIHYPQNTAIRLACADLN